MPTGKHIMELADTILADEDHVRWPLSEIAGWINEAVKAIILVKPSASSASRVVDLVAGTRQAVPQTGTPTPLRLIDVVCNITATDPVARGRVISPVSRTQLDAQEPNWHDNRHVRFAKQVRHVTFDEDNPLEYLVYPGNNGDGQIEVITSELPAPLVATDDPNSIESYSGDVGLPEPYSVPLLDYVLWRCFLKDDLQGAPQRATLHYARYAEAVGIKIQVEGATSPNARRGQQ